MGHAAQGHELLEGASNKLRAGAEKYSAIRQQPGKIGLYL